MSPTARDALAEGIAHLRDAGIDTPERDARALLAGAMGIPRDRLSLELGQPLSESQKGIYGQMLAQRSSRKPVAKILGRRLFWDRWFEVTADTLDPRPETESLIALALEKPFANLLDLGTGTGCIAVTLLAERPGARGVATDVSKAALAVAGQNAAAHGVADRLSLQVSDWFADVTGTFDLIVSNPPYIALDEMPNLAPEVRDHDPEGALTDHGDGLSAYRTIAAAAARFLRPGGRLLVEIGATQGELVREIFTAAGLDAVDIGTDLVGRHRVVSALMKGQSDT
ncbi:peptide chain release factor N(5)-glutamine methyltransferase [Psychromarinibacter sp. S121]|uniref:peptide chain release factor N(5)-glutamine methyltransferase n=1 Tax=Psychromarinibacter sp. S121 TaxID=3415127 RepID=UPI003C7CD2E7